MISPLYQTLLRVLLLGSLWGPSFFFIKVCLTDMPPLSLAFLRFGIASIFLWTLVLVKKLEIPKCPTTLAHLFIMSIFSMALPISLICIAEQHIDSALAGIINGTVPLGTVFLAHFLIKSERITLRRFSGVLSGLVGFLILLMPTVLDHNIAADTFGLLGVGSASMCYAIGIVYAKKNLKGISGLIIPTIQISFATLLTGIAAFFFEPSLTLLSPSNTTLLSLFSLALLGTVGAFVMYYQILDKDGPVILSMTAYLLPVYAIVLGSVFLGEPLTLSLFAAIGFILLGLVLINKKSRPS